MHISANEYESSEVEDVVAAAGGPTVVDVALTPRLDPSLVPIEPHPVQSLPANVRFYLPRASSVRLALYSPDGRLARTLASEPLPAGWNDVSWDGRTGAGQAAASGVYFVRLREAERSVTGRLVLVR